LLRVTGNFFELVFLQRKFPHMIFIPMHIISGKLNYFQQKPLELEA